MNSITNKAALLIMVAMAAKPAIANECNMPDPKVQLITDEECAERNISLSSCTLARDQFSKNWDAWFRNYDLAAGRKIAYDFAADDLRILHKNQMFACALRRTILHSGKLDVTAKDADWVKSACSGELLSVEERLAAFEITDTLQQILECETLN